MSPEITFPTNPQGFVMFPSPMPPIQIDADGAWHEMRLPRSYFGHLSAQQCLAIAKEDRRGVPHSAIMAKYGIGATVLGRIVLHYRRVWDAKEGIRR